MHLNKLAVTLSVLALTSTPSTFAAPLDQQPPLLQLSPKQQEILNTGINVMDNIKNNLDVNGPEAVAKITEDLKDIVSTVSDIGALDQDKVLDYILSLVGSIYAPLKIPEHAGADNIDIDNKITD
ncbi:hypothetical protein H4219_005727 [Mycoemilia scoparia]|uniref:Secreted protein n=1 Tax=Mycoemilia scoparia TaxID=417184 RepID=A0A9W8DNQ5_9FUNG|nr:hypothetical protein H4219_005727 [Mycoemilia scoparia]